MMKNYSATVITGDGKLTKVELTAKNDKEARRLAEKHGRIIVLAERSGELTEPGETTP